jgi:CheY-like chemotaxis protein
MKSSMAPVFVLCDDLIFTSRITSTARAQNLQSKSARSVEQLTGLLHQQVPSCIILDLANPGLQIESFIAQLRKECARPPRVVAFGSHVDTATLQAARAAGCDVVLPRSKFSEQLAASLSDWMSDPGADSSNQLDPGTGASG